jgi:phosphate transport system protein
MSAHFENELGNLKERLLTMGSQAETAVTEAIRALVERDDDRARAVEANDDVLDRMEIEVDETALRLLAKAPLAWELRLITVAMKIGHELERVGDSATTIARRAVDLNQEPQLKHYIDIPRMAKIALEILQSALDCFVDRDVVRARALILRDKEVDQLNKQLHRELASYMIERPSTISRCLSLMTVSKTIERIADHAKNIAEEVVFLYEGRDIRHPGSNPAAHPA